MTLALTLLGEAAGLIGFVLILVAAFRASFIWFLGSLFIPLVTLAFVITHWNEAKKGFLWTIAGVVLWLMGAAVARS